MVNHYIISMCINEGLDLVTYHSRSAKVVLTLCEAILKYIANIKREVVFNLAHVVFQC